MPGDKPEIVKIKAVAERAGVSVSTVSRVLNNNPTVARSLAVRVMRAVEETGYRPNGIARSLRTRTFSSIMFCVGAIIGVAVAGASGAAYGLAIAAGLNLVVWWLQYGVARAIHYSDRISES